MKKNSSYVAFLSYAHEDEELALKLHRKLENFRVPKDVSKSSVARPLQPIFRDEDELGAAASLPIQIRNALRDAQYLIVLCSTSSAASDWVNREIELFLLFHELEMVIPVLANGEFPQSLPPALRFAQSEFYAPDLRPHRDGFEDGSLKVAASLLGVRFGKLKDRESARQRSQARRNGVLASIFAILAAGASATAWWAVTQQQRSELLLDSTFKTIGDFVDVIDGHDSLTLSADIRKDLFFSMLGSIEKLNAAESQDDRVKLLMGNTRRRVAEALFSVAQPRRSLDMLEEWLADTSALPTDPMFRAEIISGYLTSRTTFLLDLNDPEAKAAAKSELDYARNVVERFPGELKAKRRYSHALIGNIGIESNSGISVQLEDYLDEFFDSDPIVLHGELHGNLAISQVLRDVAGSHFREEDYSKALEWAQRSVSYAERAFETAPKRSFVIDANRASLLMRAISNAKLEACKAAGVDLDRAKNLAASPNISSGDKFMRGLIEAEFDLSKAVVLESCQ